MEDQKKEVLLSAIDQILLVDTDNKKLDNTDIKSVNSENILLNIVYVLNDDKSENINNNNSFIADEIIRIIYDFSKEDKTEVLHSLLQRIIGDSRFSHLIAIIEGVIRDREREQVQSQNIAMVDSIIHDEKYHQLGGHAHLGLLKQQELPNLKDAFSIFDQPDGNVTDEFILSAVSIASLAVIFHSISKDGIDLQEHQEFITQHIHNVKKEIKESHGIDDCFHADHHEVLKEVWCKDHARKQLLDSVSQSVGSLQSKSNLSDNLQQEKNITKSQNKSEDKKKADIHTLKMFDYISVLTDYNQSISDIIDISVKREEHHSHSQHTSHVEMIKNQKDGKDIELTRR